MVTFGAQARKYFRKTLEEGLWMKKDEKEDLVVYTGSSYGPGIMWTAGRQPTPALSTAESEGVIMGDSVDLMIQELAHGDGRSPRQC